jgi:hypothetical protein
MGTRCIALRRCKGIATRTLKQLCKDYGIPCTYKEPYIPWQNRAEGGIRELKQHVHRKMTSKSVPLRLWDLCCRWSCEVRNKSAGNLYQLEGRTPYEAVMQNTPDISSLLPYDFYDYVWYYDQTVDFPESKRKPGRWLGEAQSFGQALCHWVMSDTAAPIVRSSVQPIPHEDLNSAELQIQLKALDDKIKERFGQAPSEDSIHTYSLNNLGDDDDIPDHVTPAYAPIDAESNMPDADDWEPEAYNNYISAEVRLPKDGQEILGTMTARKRDHEGNLVGRSNNNPILDIRIFQVTFPDWDSAEYSANVIAESLYSQVDDEGRQYFMLKEIINHKRTDEAISDDQIFQVSNNGNIHRRKTTKGWKLCVTWVDGFTSCEVLAGLS